MLREALRRLLWLLPTLFLATAPIFWALSRAAPAHALSPLPMFLNLEPEGVREHVDAAVSALTAGATPEAKKALAEIGGAALPHLLPRLDSLSPEARGRVAMALAPVARRMAVGDESSFGDADSAILFWNRFWEEHQIDFRPAVVRRAVRRFAERPTAIREMELGRLDTFALPELVDSMRPVTTQEDVARVGHLSRVLARVTGMPEPSSAPATLAEGRRLVDTWESFLRERGSRYRTLTGASRVGAALLETRYGKWAHRVVLGFSVLPAEAAGSATQNSLGGRAVTSLLLVLLAWTLGYPLGFVGVLVSRLTSAALLRRTASVGVLIGLGATAAGLSAGVAGFLGGFAGGAVVLVVGAATLSANRSAMAWDRLAERPFLRGARAVGASRSRAAVLALRVAAGPWLASAITDLPVLLTSAFVVERAFALDGLGEVTANALRTGNVTWLLGLALFGTLSLGIGQIAADWIHRALDPRIAAGLRDRDGAAA